MRIIVAGSRDFNSYSILKEELNNFLDSIASTPTIVSGGARGADKLGEKFAREMEYNLRFFPADWATHGKSAGYIRNKEMADYSDALVAFWDGKSKGTANMIQLALKQELIVKVIHVKA